MIIGSMKKVKAILNTFLVSAIPNHVFYPKLLHTRTFFSLKYFTFCVICLSFLFTISIYTKVMPDRLSFYHHTFIRALGTYPSGAELTLKNGRLQSTYGQPIFLWMDKLNGTRMLLFAANHHSLMRANDSVDSLIFLGEKYMRLSYKDMSTVLRYPTTEYVINKHTVNSFAEEMDQYLDNAQSVFYLIFFTFIPLIYISAAFEASLATSILLYLIFHIFTKRVHIRKCIQVGFHASILPFMIGSVLMFAFPSVHGTLTITAAILFIFQLVALYEMYFSESSKTASPHLSSRHHVRGR